jgi:uncharacterized protein YndB with AHSA1/START domain
MSNEPYLVVRRVIPVARERVFDAWLDPTRLASFMRPAAGMRSTAEVDARVGGHFRIVMFHASGDPQGVEHTGEYLIIDRPSRLAFTWRSVNTDDIATEVTVDFLEHDSGTEVVLTHRRVPERTRESHRRGWGTILEQLARTFSSQRNV